MMGGWIGSNVGRQKQAEKELKAMGLSKDIIAEAQKLAAMLTDAQSAFEAADQALQTHRQRCEALETEQVWG